MVVGRRRVAAASVATACALHVYVLPNTIFDRPVPAIPPLSSLIPIAQKFVCTRVADTSRGCWYCVRSFLSIFATLLFHPSADSLSLSLSLNFLSLGPCTLHRATRILFAYYPFVPRNAEKPREAPGSAGKRREAPRNDAPRHTPSLTLVYPSLSTHCSHSFPFAPAFYLFCSYTTRLSRTQPELKQSISYCGLSRN